MKRILCMALVAVFSIAVFGQGDAPAIPAFHKGPPPKGAKLPPIMSEVELWGPNFQNGYQKRAYVLAAKIDKVLYQEPCYCYCDRAEGHHSLRSCYEGTHAAHCDTCLKELYYTYEQTKAGKSPAQIRAGIMHGDWQAIDLEKSAAKD